MRTSYGASGTHSLSIYIYAKLVFAMDDKSLNKLLSINANVLINKQKKRYWITHIETRCSSSSCSSSLSILLHSALPPPLPNTLHFSFTPIPPPPVNTPHSALPSCPHPRQFIEIYTRENRRIPSEYGTWTHNTIHVPLNYKFLVITHPSSTSSARARYV